MLCSPLVSSSISFKIVSSLTLIDSIVYVTPLGTAYSPNSSLSLRFFNCSSLAERLSAALFFNTISCLFYLFLMSLGCSIFTFPSFSCLFAKAFIFLSSFSKRFRLRLVSASSISYFGSVFLDLTPSRFRGFALSGLPCSSTSYSATISPMSLPVPSSSPKFC